MPVWNVYIGDFSAKKIIPYNVFEHSAFRKDICDAAKKYPKNKDEFAEEVRFSLAYYYWSKCEWEILIYQWPPGKEDGGTKIDVYGQVRTNWDRFIEYVWGHRKEFEE